jgi:cation diffusion facilitator family transporter
MDDDHDNDPDALSELTHGHVFLGEGYQHAERRTWAVIILCGVMMLLEIAGGVAFGSLALVADGMHMSTHAGALLLAALAYSYARRHSHDPRFTFGTGKLGDLAGFTSAVILALIAILIGYEAIARFIEPVPIAFAEAIPIAALGLAVNVASAWLLASGGRDHHGHDGHGHGRQHGNDHGEAAGRDNNMRAAIVHVMADAAVSVLVIVGLLLARAFGWLWMDPLAGIVGACVIASWSYGLIRDTGAILLDMNPDRHMTGHLREAIECDGDLLADLHVWRLGPGHLGAIISVATRYTREPGFYRERLAEFPSISHITVEVEHLAPMHNSWRPCENSGAHQALPERGFVQLALHDRALLGDLRPPAAGSEQHAVATSWSGQIVDAQLRPLKAGPQLRERLRHQPFVYLDDVEDRRVRVDPFEVGDDLVDGRLGVPEVQARLGAQGIRPGRCQEGHDSVPCRDTVPIKQSSVVAVEELDRRPE